MERSGRKATDSAIFLAPPVPLTSREEEGRYWCDPLDAGVCRLVLTAGVYGLDRFGFGEDRGDVDWSCVDLRSGR